MCSGTFLRRGEKVSEPISETVVLVKTVISYYCDSCGLVAERYVASTEQVEVKLEETEKTDDVESP